MEMVIAEKVLAYETFLNEKLKGDLKKLLEQRDAIYATTADYLQLRNVLERITGAGLEKEKLKAQVDLGCNFYAQAIIDDPSKVMVKIGLDYYLEFTIADAIPFILRKIKHLEAIAEKLSKEIVNVHANIELVLQGLREIQMINLLPEEVRPVDL